MLEFEQRDAELRAAGALAAEGAPTAALSSAGAGQAVSGGGMVSAAAEESPVRI